MQGSESLDLGVSTMKDFYGVKISTLWAELKGERASFWFICAYLFLEYVRPQSIYTAIDVIPYAFVTIILTFTAYILEANRQNISNAENRLIVLFLLAILLSSVFAFTPAESFKHLSLFLSWLVIYYLIIHIVNTEKRFFIFYLSFLLYSFKMSQHGFITWAQRGFAFTSWGVTGAPGWFQNSGEFGIQLCIFLPLSIYFIIALRQYWGKMKLIFFLLFPFTAIASVIATSSRGALIGAVAALIWMVIKSKKKTMAFVSVAIVLAIAYTFIPAKSYERLEASGDDGTSVARLTRWKAGIDMMNENPVFGVGYENWSTYYKSFYYIPDQASLLSHNIFIQAGAELGYTGLIIYLIMILYSFVNNHRTRKRALATGNNFILYTAHGLDAALVGFLVSAFFVTVLYYPYFWINTALVVALNNVANKQFEQMPKASVTLNAN